MARSREPIRQRLPHRIELLIKDSAHFDASILLADAKASTLLDAATAKAIRDGEIAAEARATAIAIALRVGALFAELYRLVGQDGAAEFFDAMAERARDGFTSPALRANPVCKGHLSAPRNGRRGHLRGEDR
jgi:hypothetical protein